MSIISTREFRGLPSLSLSVVCGLAGLTGMVLGDHY